MHMNTLVKYRRHPSDFLITPFRQLSYSSLYFHFTHPYLLNSISTTGNQSLQLRKTRKYQPCLPCAHSPPVSSVPPGPSPQSPSATSDHYQHVFQNTLHQSGSRQPSPSLYPLPSSQLKHDGNQPKPPAAKAKPT